MTDTTAQIRIIYWRDIPAQVISEAAGDSTTGRRAGRRGKHNTAKQELPAQFAKAIDAAAMRGGATDSDAYLSDWRKGETMAASADIDTVLARLITDYPSERLARLVANGGYDRDPKE